MTPSSAAHRYASSLFGLAAELGLLDQAKADVETFVATVHQVPQLRAVLVSPVINSEKKAVILKEIFGKRVSPLISKFFANISEHNREALLPEIMQAFLDLHLAKQGIVKAQVVAAAPLSKEALAQSSLLAERISGKKVQLHAHVDPELLGGFILRVEDRELDQSVAARLERIRRQLTTAH